jgi:uncharacterized protein YaaW (UPF0174 family)
VVCDAAKHLKVNFNKKQSVEDIEKAIFDKVISDQLEKMTDKEREELISGLGGSAVGVGAASSAAILGLFRAGGFKSYVIALRIVNKLWRHFFGKGLTFAANAAMAKWLSVATGPVGIAVSAAWTLADISSPAMRITMPSVMYVAMLRMQHNVLACDKCGESVQKDERFCSSCGEKLIA